MAKRINYDESITNESIWNTGTPSSISLKMPLYGLEAGHFFTESDYKVERNFHDSFLIICTLKGSGLVNDINVLEGHSILIDCHKPHFYKSSDAGWEFIWLHFNGTFAESLYEMVAGSDVASVKINKDFVDILSYITNNFYIQNALNLLDISSKIQKLIQLYLESSIKCSEKDLLKKNMEDAMDYIHSHYNEQISIDDISNYVNLSKYHFIRSFKRITGVTPYAYLINYRVTCAKRMLVESTMSVEAISFASGFLDTANFISKFKQHTGLSPLKYRAMATFKA